MKKFTIEITSRVGVQFDMTKFTPEIMKGFNECVQDFGTGPEALELHAKHIADRAVAGEWFNPPDFAEGYGIVRDAGISVAIHNETDIEVISEGGAA